VDDRANGEGQTVGITCNDLSFFFNRKRVAIRSGFVRLAGIAICSLTDGMALHELNTCVMLWRANDVDQDHDDGRSKALDVVNPPSNFWVTLLF
jgi:hypothetical protein